MVTCPLAQPAPYCVRSANEKSVHAIPPSETFHWKQRHFQNAAMHSIAHHAPKRWTSRLAIELRGRQHPISKRCWSILGANDYARSRPAVWKPQTRTYAQGQQPRRAPRQPKATAKAVPMEPRARHHTPCGGGERNSAPPSTSSGCSSRLPTSNPPLSSHPIRNCTKRTPHRDGAFETSATGSACCWKTPTKRARNGRPGNET